LITVFAVLALAVFGVGGAYAYRTFTSSARSGEPPIIRADAGPTKIIPAPADGGTKVPDRMAPSDGTEKMVSREETPVDPSTRSAGPRVVFPALTPNGTAPMPTSVLPPSVPPPTNAANGTFSNNDPRKIKTFSVRGDQPDAGSPAGAAPPTAAAKSAAAPRAAAPNARTAASNPSAANANAPLSLAPQSDAPAAAEPPVRVATTSPTQTAPSAPASGGGNFLVQVSSQRNEADAQASFRSLQSKFPSVLGSRAPVIKRADLGDKGVYYRAMVGPFSSPDEASQFCGSLKSAGGQCVVQRN
jgi:cell division septation protein DedD